MTCSNFMENLHNSLLFLQYIELQYNYNVSAYIAKEGSCGLESIAEWDTGAVQAS